MKILFCRTARNLSVAAAVYLVCMMTAMPARTSAQTAGFQITTYDVKPGLTYDDIWNMNIITSGAHVFSNFFIIVKVLKQNSGMVISARTADFYLEPGLTPFTSLNYAALLQPVVEYTSSPEFQQLIQSGGYFPPGQYTLVYQLYGRTTDIMMGQVTELVSDYFHDKYVTVFFPAMLLEPSDETVFYYNTTNQIFFAWTPAFLQSSPYPPLYDISLYYVNPGQTPEAAVQAKQYVFSETGLSTTFYNYPAVAQNLYDSVQYAWQVNTNSFDGRQAQPIDASEVWWFEFTTELDSATPIPSPNPRIKFYFKMQDDLQNNFAFDNTYDSLGNRNHILRFVFNEPYYVDTTHKLKYKLFNDKNEQITSLPELNVHYQENVYFLDFSGLGIAGGYYILEVANSKNEKQYLRYHYDP